MTSKVTHINAGRKAKKSGSGGGSKTVAPFRTGSHGEIAARMMADLKPRFPDAPGIVYAEGNFYRYTEIGVWEVLTESKLNVFAVTHYDGAVVAGKRKEVRVDNNTAAGIIEQLRHLVCANYSASNGFFADAAAGLLFANTFVRLTTTGLKLEKPCAEHRARVRYEFEYNPAVVPHQFLNFLNEIFRDDEDKLDRIAFVQQFFGIAMVGWAPRYTKAAFLRSPGGSGRSALGTIMSAAMPPGTNCNIKPHEFKSEYSRAQLAGKRLNFVDECPKSALLETDYFKQVVTGNSTVGRNPYNKPFTFAPEAAHCFAAQELPPTGDLTAAFFARVVTLDFSRNFRAEGIEDRSLPERIIAAELPAIVNWLLVGAERLIRQNRYTIPASHEATVRAWREDSDSVAAFLADFCILVSNWTDGDPIKSGWTPSTQLYIYYTAWCERMGCKPVGHRTMVNRLIGLKIRRKDSRMVACYAVRARKQDEAPMNPLEMLNSKKH